MKSQKQELLKKIEEVLLHPNQQKQMHAVGVALTRILQNQTSDEVATQCTRYHNGVGFTGAHGEIGTSMAQFYMKRGFLTPKQVKYWTEPMGKLNRPRILMYRNQLLKFAESKISA